MDKNIPEEDLKIFEEKVSGKNIDDRKQLLELLSFLRERDTLVVASLDRLGRNSKDIKELLQHVRAKGANVEILDLPSFAGVNDPTLRDLLTNLVIEVFSYVAETERNKIKERQQQGIKLAKERGIYKGRPLKYHKDAKGADKLVYDKVVSMIDSGFTIAVIAREVNLPRKTVYAIKARISEKENKDTAVQSLDL
jgi:Site-specific recombinases, DNA invertase Pin homologs